MAGKGKKEKRGEKIRSVFYFDYSLLFIMLLLTAFGLIMIYSTSAYTAELHGDGADYYFKKQLFNCGVGLFVMIAATFFNYRIIRGFTGFVYILSIVLCALVYSPIGMTINGSRRWIRVAGVSFQPSEFAKLAVLLVVAYIAAKNPKEMSRFGNVIKVFFIISPIAGLVAYTNLSNAIIIVAIALFILFVVSKRYLQFILSGGIMAALAVALIVFSSYRGDRIEAWLSPETSDKGYQTLQALYAIGSGGWFGKGLGQSLQKLGYVPEAQNDMIFSIICEELGIFGAACVILLFALMIWRFVAIAMNARDLYGSLLVVGVVGHVATQVILNIAVVTNTIPNTGISLPFISYGGTSVMFLMAEMGIVLNVSRNIRIEEDVYEGK